MKLILLSTLIAFFIICVYLAVASVFVIATDYKLIPGSYIDFPLRLPKIIFYYFSPPNEQDFASEFSIRKVIVLLVTLLGNLLIYSVPFYLILSLFRKNKASINEEPPPPPKFTDNAN